MFGVGVPDSKQWIEFVSTPLKEDFPGFAYQAKFISINGHDPVSTFTTPLLQLNTVEESASIGATYQKNQTYWPLIDDIVCTLQMCRKEKNLVHAMRIHGRICDVGLNTHVIVESHFVPLFVECGSINDAQHAFNRLVSRNEYSWAYLIRGYADIGELQHAFSLFRTMQDDSVHPSSKSAFTIFLKACAKIKSIARGMEIHIQIVKQGFESDPFIGSALVDIYMKIGLFTDAREVFDDLPVRDVVLWTSLIGGYIGEGLCEEAFTCYKQMQLEGVASDRVTYILSLNSCSSLGATDMGQTIHSEIIKEGFEIASFVICALVGMYSKAGWLSEAKDLLLELPLRSVVEWNALIAGYCEHGFAEETLKFLEEMRSDNISPDDCTFVCSLKSCGCVGAVHIGQEIHMQIAKQGFESDNFIGSTLVDMYSKCGLLKEAYDVFEELATRDVVSWTSLIAGYAAHGFCEQALSFFEDMEMDGTSPDALTFVCTLNGCLNTRDLERGRNMHIETTKRGMESGTVISSTLVKMYAEAGLFTEAEAVFDRLRVKDHLSWNGLIGGLLEYGLDGEALYCMNQMEAEGVSMNVNTFLNGLKACRNIEAVEKGLELHMHLTKYGLDANPFLGNNLVDLYCKCGYLSEAQKVFDGLPVHGTVSWTTLVAAHAQLGHSDAVFDCLEHMQMEGVSQDVVTFICSLKACCSIGAVNKGKELHAQIICEGLESDTFVGSTLVDMYAKCGFLCEAHEVLDELPTRNVVSWTAVVVAYAKQAHTENALRCFLQMQSEGIPPNAITYCAVLKACRSAKLIRKGQEIHSEMVKVGIEAKWPICNTLVDLYATYGWLTESQHIFDKLVTRDISSWNALIGGYVEDGQGKQALHLFEEMRIEGTPPNDVTYLHGLRASYYTGTIDIGQDLHAGIIKKGIEANPFVSSSLVDMYAKLSAFPEAKKVLFQMPVRDTVSWSSLIVGYSEQGLGLEALNCFGQMQLEGIFCDAVAWNAVLLGCAEQGEYERILLLYPQMLEWGTLPTSATFVSVIEACGKTSALELAKNIYSQCYRDGILEGTEIIVATALVDMYGNCGNMALAQQVFDAIPLRDTTMWNALITGYSRQGEIDYALDIFERMKKEGAKPDAITFLCVLTVCNHAGLLDRAQEYFESMSTVYSIPSSMKHHNCMMDLLCRTGNLNDALRLLSHVWFPPSYATVNTLLGACQKWADVEVSKQVFEYAVQLDLEHSGTFVLMSNIYADVHIPKD